MGEHQFQTLDHGVISFERLPPEYGRARRRMQISKLRGIEFHDGYHDCLISKGGVIVYPRLVSIGHRRSTPLEKVPSGVAKLDELLAGGPERGTSALLSAPLALGRPHFVFNMQLLPLTAARTAIVALATKMWLPMNHPVRLALQSACQIVAASVTSYRKTSSVDCHAIQNAS